MKLNARAEYVFEQGLFINTRFDGMHYIQLWLLEKFYAEVFYAPDKNKIENITAFKTMEKVLPYLDEVVSLLLKT